MGILWRLWKEKGLKIGIIMWKSFFFVDICEGCEGAVVVVLVVVESPRCRGRYQSDVGPHRRGSTTAITTSTTIIIITSSRILSLFMIPRGVRVSGFIPGFRRSIRRYKTSPPLSNPLYNENANFTKFGILPFLQHKLNQVINSKNVIPSPDQRNLLTALNSDNNVVLKSNTQSGKSLSLLVYVINRALSTIPPHGALKSLVDGTKSSIGSVIVVPDNYLLAKYYKWTQDLVEDITSDCVPYDVNRQKDGSYRTMRKPLVVDFINTRLDVERVSTNPTATSRPDILITTPSSFYKMFGDQRDQRGLDPAYNTISIPTPNAESLLNCKFIAVDEADYMLSTTEISHNWNDTVFQLGLKDRYQNVVSLALTKLRKIQEDYFINRARDRARDVFFPSDVPNTFDYGEFIVNSQEKDLKTELRSRYPEMEAQLVNKIVKESKRLIYKPIQYAFIVHSQQPFHESFVKTASGVKSPNISEFLKNMVRSQFKTRKFITIGGFNDRDFFTKSNEKRINLTLTQTYGLDGKRRSRVWGIDPLKNLPQKQDYHQVFHNFAKTYNYKLKENYRKYLTLKTRRQIKYIKTDAITQYIYSSISKSVDIFRRTFPDTKSPILIVVPPYVDYHSMARRFNNKHRDKSDQFRPMNQLNHQYQTFLNSDYPGMKPGPQKWSRPLEIPKEFIDANIDSVMKHEVDNKNRFHNVICNPSELLGMDIKGVNNILIMGFECLLPQLAFNSYRIEKGEEHPAARIPGIEFPYHDMFYNYILKFQMDKSEGEKNLMIVASCAYKKKDMNAFMMLNEDMEKLEQMLVYNDVFSYVKYCEPKYWESQRRCEESHRELKYEPFEDLGMKEEVFRRAQQKKRVKKKVKEMKREEKMRRG